MYFSGSSPQNTEPDEHFPGQSSSTSESSIVVLHSHKAFGKRWGHGWPGYINSRLPGNKSMEDTMITRGLSANTALLFNSFNKSKAKLTDKFQKNWRSFQTHHWWCQCTCTWMSNFCLQQDHDIYNFMGVRIAILLKYSWYLNPQTIFNLISPQCEHKTHPIARLILRLLWFQSVSYIMLLYLAFCTNYFRRSLYIAMQ